MLPTAAASRWTRAPRTPRERGSCSGAPPAPGQTIRKVTRPAQISLQPRASTAFRLVVPGTSGTSLSVAVAPRVQVQALSPRVLAGEVSPRPDASVAVSRPRARALARRRASDPRLEREVQDAAAAQAGRLPGHRRGREAGGRADVAPRHASSAPELALSNAARYLTAHVRRGVLEIKRLWRPRFQSTIRAAT